MTYWRALEERSRILWQTLFRQSTLIEQNVPVYINTRSAPKGAEGEGQAALQPPAPEESAWTAGAEAEALRQPERCRAVGGTPPYDASISSPACTAAPSPKNAL